MTRATGRPSLPLHTVGLSLAFCGAAMLASALVEVVSGDTDDWVALAVTGVIVNGAGYAIRSATSVPKAIPLLDVFATVAGTWVVISLVGTLPYLLTGTLTELDLALFESVSGFTTTGATVIGAGPDPLRYAASDGILFWRSITQWMGGMGVIALVVAVLPSIGSRGMGMMAAEAPGPTGERLTPRVRSTARRLWAVYLGFTVVVMVAYLLVGMNVFEAVTHAFTTVSTGGFSPNTASIAHYDRPLLEWLVVLFMFVAGTSFPLLYRILRGRPGSLIRSVEFRTYVAIVALSTLLVFLTADAGPRDLQALRHATFTVVSIVSTTGYGATDFTVWSDSAKGVLLILMPLGAMSGSTAGGIKMIRLVAVASFAHRASLGQLHSRLVRPIRIGPSIIDDRVANQIVGLVVLALAAFGAGSLLIVLTGVDLVTAFSASATSFGNVGPGLGEVSADFLAIPAFGRLVSVALMVLGRLEIYPILLALVKLPIPRARPTLARLSRAGRR